TDEAVVKVLKIAQDYGEINLGELVLGLCQRVGSNQIKHTPGLVVLGRALELERQCSLHNRHRPADQNGEIIVCRNLLRFDEAIYAVKRYHEVIEEQRSSPAERDN